MDYLPIMSRASKQHRPSFMPRLDSNESLAIILVLCVERRLVKDWLVFNTPGPYFNQADLDISP